MPAYHDLSVSLDPRLPVWPESHGVRISRLMTAEKDGWNVSRLDIDVHSGTHIDAPLHLLPDGKTTNEIPLEKLIGPCVVADLRGRAKITATDLAGCDIPDGTQKLLCKTDNSRHWVNPFHTFREDFCALTADAAQWVVDRGIHLVGIDYHSIQLFHDPPDTHRILLENEVVIVETLNLLDIAPGTYRLFCLPTKVNGVEGISARVVLEAE
ncbi:MAG: cyclase family protein [Bacteroidetes bacterium]|nr:MAG: cyclase family protein [Bacteroidota bacterium]